MFKHEDDRRSLIELTNGEYKACKVVVAKRDCVVGGHHHKKKDERFMLVRGIAAVGLIGGDGPQDLTLQAPAEFLVPRGIHHTIALSEGSIMVVTMTEEYDPADDYGWPLHMEDDGTQ